MSQLFGVSLGALSLQYPGLCFIHPALYCLGAFHLAVSTEHSGHHRGQV